MNDSVARRPMKCKAKRTDGQPCKAWPIKGAEVCRVHGGRAPQVKAAAKRRRVLGEAQEELNRLGVPIEVDTAEAMLQMVYEAAGNVAFLRKRIQQLEQGGRLTGDFDADDVVSALGAEDNRRASIAGRVDPKNWKGEPHVLVTMYNEERERLVRWSKSSRDANVEEHRVKLAERQGEMLARVLRVLLESVLSALVSAGAPESLVRQVWTSEVPGIVRRALGEASGEVV